MGKYQIILTDPLPYKNKIIEFWDQYLPGTPPSRFEWLRSGNPAGETLWFLAVEEATNELLGTISLMPRGIYYKGRFLKAGIMGDFMVSSKCRVFGPALVLVKTALSQSRELGFDVVYTIPNEDSKKLIERSGLSESNLLHHLARPISTKHYLKNFVPEAIASLLAPLCNIGISLASRETYAIGNYTVREEYEIDPSFDTLWEKTRTESRSLLGDHCSQYLHWRYFENPECKFRLITCRNRNEETLFGYLFFTMSSAKMEIYDIVVKDQKHVYIIMKRLIQVAKDQGCQSIYARVSSSNWIISCLRRCLFMDSKDDVSILNNSNKSIPMNDWCFLNGDRNI